MAESKSLDKLYDLAEKMIDGLTAKGDLTQTELKAAIDAVCLMHKIRHFDMDVDKYGWNEDAGISERGYYPMYSNGSYYDGGSYRNNMPRNGHSYNMRNGYSGAKEHLIQEAQRMMDAAVDDKERMAIMGYINRLNS